MEESWRRNLARYDRDRRGGILTHSLPWEECEHTYRTDDWRELPQSGRDTWRCEGYGYPTWL
ncbi:hypothetical protein H5T52_04005 [Candidatus Bipolaricaulota bacterium]|nr:hypothetical protein [Candidatus Bipolaricaulota bacterium]